jgi:hypothetical protein
VKSTMPVLHSRATEMRCRTMFHFGAKGSAPASAKWSGVSYEPTCQARRHETFEQFHLFFEWTKVAGLIGQRRIYSST